MGVLRALYSRVSQRVWSALHFRVGSRGQVRTNKGFKPTNFPHFGAALFFARHSKGLTRDTVEKFVRLNVSEAQKQEMKSWRGGLVNSIEKGTCIPSREVQSRLEQVVGVPLTRRKKAGSRRL
ncbi:hypothetical protein BESB_004970 [Besnoitia besnoiti]|uniref:Uncharacterized protein n=1 Tax=Besnoitia besnoiti TaxID=94643 RepID=A0A2A9MPA3_BESBE|nr:hypothetical protein BESB_004970 [Besnoitia besnoiti]PFH38156.1 hypothetical protein BESB_004970 [Besnoitia besnoiti]